MSLKSSFIALAGMVGKCQENSRSLKQCLELGLLGIADSTLEKNLSMIPIWSNSDTTASFAGQTVTADITGEYSAYMVLYGNTTGVIEDSVIAIDSVLSRLAVSRLGSDGKLYQTNRDVTITASDGAISAVFTGCSTLEATALGSSISWVTNNSMKIPYAIYGIR